MLCYYKNVAEGKQDAQIERIKRRKRPTAVEAMYAPARALDGVVVFERSSGGVKPTPGRWRVSQDGKSNPGAS
jgi:hypothetical protein